ncbi:MAG: DUF4174 domain-containing protein [Vibrionaceae bacterium]|nr:DUF4174 domain-containing protein [Vibrionaceae bacterium]
MRYFLGMMLLVISTQYSLAYPAHSGQWTHRSVIYFAPSNDEHVKQFLLESIINDCNLEERDIVTLVITEDGYTAPSWIKEIFDLRQMFLIYGVTPGKHTAILIGKDGSEKLRWGKETNWESVMKTVDLMPMRQREMEKRISPCSA